MHRSAGDQTYISSSRTSLYNLKVRDQGSLRYVKIVYKQAIDPNHFKFGMNV